MIQAFVIAAFISSCIGLAARRRANYALTGAMFYVSIACSVIALLIFLSQKLL